VDAWNRGVLRTQVRQWIPTRIEEHKHGTNVMPGRDGQELVNPLLESGGVLLPQQVMKKNSHGVHAHGFGPSELGIDLNRIEGHLLPHLELVDGRLWNVIASQ
jgi:hypothetical protein